jgi:glycosyltransferase involved in cell wall biosynthesis
MRLLILTQYFPPETGAPQNRLYELALRLKAAGIEVEVLTAMPSYPLNEIYEGYKNKKRSQEIISGILVHRTSIYVTKSKKIIPRLRNYFSFVISSWRFGRKLPHFDFILCESPPLFLGYSAIALSKKLQAKLIFNVSDLWPESAEKLGIVTNKFLLNFAYRLEARCYRRSFLITGQTQGIVSNILQRFPEKKVHWLPNGANIENFKFEEISEIGFRTKYKIASDELVFFYGGILGHAQGLDLVVRAAERLKHTKAKFILMGSGPEKAELMELTQRLELSNVIFPDPVGRTEITSVLKEIDIALVPLRKLDIFTGAIPSKIFEALAMSKPLLLGVDGEARELFITQANAGWFFEPENVDDLVTKIEGILADRQSIADYGNRGRQYVIDHFDRNKIADAFIEKLTEKDI